MVKRGNAGNVAGGSATGPESQTPRGDAAGDPVTAVEPYPAAKDYREEPRHNQGRHGGRSDRVHQRDCAPGLSFMPPRLKTPPSGTADLGNVLELFDAAAVRTYRESRLIPRR